MKRETFFANCIVSITAHLLSCHAARRIAESPSLLQNYADIYNAPGPTHRLRADIFPKLLCDHHSISPASVAPEKLSASPEEIGDSLRKWAIQAPPKPAVAKVVSLVPSKMYWWLAVPCR
jgi:hypothetical protein